MLSVDAGAGTITYREPETGDEITQPVTGGSCKVQWKPDWALRWYALQVDYEMYGKDLIDSAKIAARITSALGGPAPEGFSYELFLDEQGQKISKSKGNGLSIEEWLEYGPAESLSLYMFQRLARSQKAALRRHPQGRRRLRNLPRKFPGEAGEKQLENPARHIHGQDRVPAAEDGVSFGMLLNLASVVNADDPGVLWAFIQRYRPPRLARRAHPLAAGRPRGFLLPRSGGADEILPRPDRGRGRRLHRAGHRARGLRRPEHPGRRPANRCVHRGQGRRLREPARVVPGALSGPAGSGSGPALRLLHRALWRR